MAKNNFITGPVSYGGKAQQLAIGAGVAKAFSRGGYDSLRRDYLQNQLIDQELKEFTSVYDKINSIPKTGVETFDSNINAFFNQGADKIFKVKDLSPRNIAINLRYKTQEFKKELGDAINIYNSMKNQQRGITPEEFRYNFEKSNTQQYNLLRDFSILIQDARELGVSDKEIAKVLRLEVGGVRGW